jgi:SWI/SNF-related matrix-associated actin-dependent regulator of chromatin subfamily A-like protein 1
MTDYVRDLLEGVQKFLLFVHHQFVMDAFAALLDRQGVGFVRIDGHTPSDLRQAHCNRFQSTPDCRVALLSITAASVGPCR